MSCRRKSEFGVLRYFIPGIEPGIEFPGEEYNSFEEVMMMTAMEKVCAFLKEAGAYYLATVDGDQPRVRPFGTIHIYEGKLYIQTGRGKDVAKQLAANPKAEICAFKDGVWLRVAGELVDDNRVEPKKSMLEAYPELRAMYDPEDNNTEVLYFKNAKATFSSFTAAPETVEF